MVTATIMVGSREIQYMAARGQFPPVLKYQDPVRSTPVNAVFAVAIGSAVILCLPFEELVEVANAGSALCYLMEFASFYVFRRVRQSH